MESPHIVYQYKYYLNYERVYYQLKYEACLLQRARKLFSEYATRAG